MVSSDITGATSSTKSCETNEDDRDASELFRNPYKIKAIIDSVITSLQMGNYPEGSLEEEGFTRIKNLLENESCIEEKDTQTTPITEAWKLFVNKLRESMPNKKLKVYQLDETRVVPTSGATAIVLCSESQDTINISLLPSDVKRASLKPNDNEYPWKRLIDLIDATKTEVQNRKNQISVDNSEDPSVKVAKEGYEGESIALSNWEKALDDYGKEILVRAGQ